MKNMRRLTALTLCLGLAFICADAARAQQQEEPSKRVEELSLEELLDVTIVSASNKSEKLSEAPATVIVITRDDIKERGYLELSEIFDDLPGMQIIRAFGDTYFKNYQRGYRNTIGAPYLLMIDNIIQNSLYYNDEGNMVTFPIANIERVEIVYGPASSVYGANAFMGVINILTVKDRESDGTSISTKLSGGSLNSRIADVSFLHKIGKARFSVAGRFDYGELDAQASERYEWTKNRYFADTLLWGGFVKNPNIAGRNGSYHRNAALDIRAAFGGSEIGFMYNEMRNGNGNVYPGDKEQNIPLWIRPELSVHLRQQIAFNERFSSTTLARYRQSGISNNSYNVDGYNKGAERFAAFSYWQALNWSFAVYQDFQYDFNSQFGVNFGLKYEQKDLQKRYDTTYGPYVNVKDLPDLERYFFPTPPMPSAKEQNRIVTRDNGVYAQARYKIGSLFGGADEHNIIGGARIDDNSSYGSSAVIRAGYVGQFGEWGAKALFGQAFQEPVPRVLFGGWKFSGSDPTLKPERSATFEGSLSYTTKSASVLASAYRVNNTNTIVTFAGGARNAGERSATGLDVHLQTIIPTSFFKQLKGYAYYSFIATDEKKFKDTTYAGNDVIGDIASHQVMFGVTGVLSNDLSLNVRGRFVGARLPVESNPARALTGDGTPGVSNGAVSAYFTADANVAVRNLLAKGFGIALRITNLFDAAYFHPGLREADAGFTPGFFDKTGVWHGSAGAYSSLLAQPGRCVHLSLTFEI